MKSYGGPGTDEGRAIIQTPDYGYILVGRSILGLRALRLNPYGDTIWNRELPGYVGTDIVKTNDNNFVILGAYSNVIKIDIDGNIIWNRGPFDPDLKTTSIKEITNGDFIICGRKDTLGIITKPYLFKMNSNGFMVWGRTYNSNIFDGSFSDIEITNDNNLLLTGSYSNSADTITDELFIMKVDTQGTPLFFYGYDTVRYFYAGFITNTIDGSFIVGGSRTSLLKINSNGIIQWQKQYITGLPNSCRSIAKTNDNGYALTGWWDSTGKENEVYAFLIKTDSEGSEIFRKTYQYELDDSNIGNDVKQTSDSGYIITGIRENQNNEDIIIIKTDKNGLFNTIGIEPVNIRIPEAFTLYQNYPNPFNPSTNIKFSIPVVSHVKISVYDVNGRIVETLINSKMEAGNYNALFRANDLPSGVYFVVLENSNGAKLSQKIILLK